MGELIRREAAAAPQTFTGERLTAAISGQVEIEHYHRYLLAREFCRGRDVLDVATGEGYGTALLAQIARSAVGIEIDADTVFGPRVHTGDVLANLFHIPQYLRRTIRSWRSLSLISVVQWVRIDPQYLRPAEVHQLLGDPSKARRHLGWRHRTTFPELVCEMVDDDIAILRDEGRKPRG